MSVARRSESAIAVTEGMKLPGKMKRWMKSTDFSACSYTWSWIVIACSSMAPSGFSSEEHLAVYVSRYCAPTASIISTDTSLS